MKYCSQCGTQLNENANFCSNCGKSFSNPNNYPINYTPVQNNGSSVTVVICAIVGLLFPIIGAILYYVFRDSDIRAARTANLCSWISFLGQILCYFALGVSIFSLGG